MPHNSRRDFLGALSLAAAPQRPAAPAEDVDVLVAGGGPAGIGAALAATRAGAKTLLVERHAILGGVAAWGMGMTIN